MINTASTRDIIEYLEEYERIHGVGSVTSIGSVCSGNRNIEYTFRIKDKDGSEVCIEIPSLDERTLWRNENDDAFNLGYCHKGFSYK